MMSEIESESMCVQINTASTVQIRHIFVVASDMRSRTLHPKFIDTHTLGDLTAKVTRQTADDDTAKVYRQIDSG